MKSYLIAVLGALALVALMFYAQRAVDTANHRRCTVLYHHARTSTDTIIVATRGCREYLQ